MRWRSSTFRSRSAWCRHTARPTACSTTRARPPDRGIEVIIAGAGGAAHLPGMVASATPLPVIGVPVPLAKLDGLDSLLSIVQMPAGVPVATVSIGGARNAGLLAVRILGASDAAAAQAGRGIPGAARRHRCWRRTPPCGTGCWGPTVKLLASSKEFSMAGNPDFDVFKLPDEHDELRAVLRDLCEKEIAPHAADVDEKPRFPDEALKALNESGFSAVHVPEEYGGQGADSVATCIVIEEVARVCASSSLIPAVNKLGTMGLILCGLGRAQEAGAADARLRRGDGVVCAVGARSGQRRRGDAHPRPRRTAIPGCSTAPRRGSPTAASRPGTR